MNTKHVNVGDILKVIRVEDDAEAEYVGKKGEVTEVHLFPNTGNVYELRMEDGVRVEFYDDEVEPVEEPEDSAMRQIFVEIPSTRGEVQSYEPNFDWGAGDREWEEMEAVGREIIYDVYNTDSVEHPSHYTQGGVEVIEIIAQTVSGYDDGFTAHCVGTATKYLNRAPYKHETPLEDLKKAAKYLEFAIEHEEKKRK